LGYAFIIAMTATSFDRTAALIGPTAWRWLHTAGAYFIWFDFAKSIFPRAIHSPFYSVFGAALVLALGLRLFASFQSRKPGVPTMTSPAAI
jgi:sulfoxide reductase heme-binding subunit YedZ